MLTRRFFNGAIVTAALVLTLAPAWANSAVPFSAEAFKAAQEQGSPILVEIHADWCPTCKEQKPIVDALLKDERRKSVTLLLADFDTEEALKDRLHVTQQSTFVVFKAGKEVGRSTGQTQKTEIAALL